MSDNQRRPRAAPSTQVRRWHARLAQIVSQRGFVRGTIVERLRVCGKPNCRCAKGHKHRAVYLVLSKDGRTRQLYVPTQWEPVVRQWVSNYRDVRDLMEKISELNWERVQKRQG